MRSALVLLLTAALLVLAQFQDRRWKLLEVFNGDAGGYYVYLPSAFIRRDVGRADWFWAVRRRHHPTTPPLWAADLNDWGLRALPATGRVLSKYPPGVALGAAPWFAAAHWYARWQGQPADGFGRPYQRSSMMAGLAYVLLGLVLLRAVLRRCFDDGVAAWTLAGVGLGTNLFCYGSYEAAMAHAPLFLWHAALLGCTVRWHATPRRRWAAGIGLCWGMVVLCRPTDGLFALLPLLWGLPVARGALANRFGLLRAHGGHVLLAALLGGALVGLLPLLWHYASGQWLLYTYGQERFDFGHPHLLDGLFSFRKGWLVYTPLMAVALLGTGALRRRLPAAFWPTLVLVPLVLYVTFSWEQWWYGGGFGARSLISLYPLLGLSLASLWAAARARGRAAPRRVLALATVLLVLLNLMQTWQYGAGILHWDNTTREVYLANFGRLRGAPSDGVHAQATP